MSPIRTHNNIFNRFQTFHSVPALKLHAIQFPSPISVRYKSEFRRPSAGTKKYGKIRLHKRGATDIPRCESDAEENSYRPAIWQMPPWIGHIKATV